MEIARTMRTINRKLTSLNIGDNKITNDDVEALTEVRDMILTNQVKRERERELERRTDNREPAVYCIVVYTF